MGGGEGRGEGIGGRWRKGGGWPLGRGRGGGTVWRQEGGGGNGGRERGGMYGVRRIVVEREEGDVKVIWHTMINCFLIRR